MFSEKELEKQTSTAKKYILFGFLPTIILAVLISIYRINSLDYNKKEYLRIKNLEIKGKVIQKYRDYNKFQREKYLEFLKEKK